MSVDFRKCLIIFHIFLNVESYLLFSYSFVFGFKYEPKEIIRENLKELNQFVYIMYLSLRNKLEQRKITEMHYKINVMVLLAFGNKI